LGVIYLLFLELVPVTNLEDAVDGLFTLKGDKSEPTGALGFLIVHHHYVLNGPELLKVLLENRCTVANVTSYLSAKV
jgi:hypothetical protein